MTNARFIVDGRTRVMVKGPGVELSCTAAVTEIEDQGIGLSDFRTHPQGDPAGPFPEGAQFLLLRGFDVPGALAIDDGRTVRVHRKMSRAERRRRGIR